MNGLVQRAGPQQALALVAVCAHRLCLPAYVRMTVTKDGCLRGPISAAALVAFELNCCRLACGCCCVSLSDGASSKGLSLAGVLSGARDWLICACVSCFAQRCVNTLSLWGDLASIWNGFEARLSNAPAGTLKWAVESSDILCSCGIQGQPGWWVP